ncbi:inositol-pentakisphosphate 2-kinase [Daedaleopsis nitida]|nr:inositol-pentakisphosphate 2-kinase [Daedaleopsis nitida]
MSADPHIGDTSPHDWKYVSEGGSTIVFSYSGPPHPDFDGTALRLRKGPVPAHEEPDKYDTPELVEPDDPTIVFQHAVIERLVPKQYLPHLYAVHVERRWLQELRALVEPHRPQERREKDRIAIERTKAVLATDLVGGLGWAVEIKPKWGFLPAPTHLSPETRAVKTRTCRFCMHAHLKRAHGEDASLGYCPLDLFSADEARVTRALHALWAAWLGSGGAVNNLRVFIEGKMLKPAAEGDPLPSLAPLAAQLFPAPDPSDPPSDPFADPVPPVDTPALREVFTAVLLPLLLGTPVLRTLSTLQRTLDALDVEGLAQLWAALRPAGRALGKGEEDPDTDEWTRFVDAYQARQQAGEPVGAELAAEAQREEELRYRMAAYLLSASFKDCSIILRMRPGQRGAVTVIDLDVKSIDRLSKWAKLDKEIVDAYKDMPPRNCVDSWASA